MHILTLPNAVSALKFPIGLYVFYLAIGDYWVAAFAWLATGALLDVADGLLARLLTQESDFGRDILEPASDFWLCAWAIGGLWLSGAWPWWMPIVAFLPAFGLQVIHWKRNASDLMRKLKRFQHVAHPMYAVAVMIVAISSYAWLAAGGSPIWRSLLLSLIVMTMLTLAFIRRDWFAAKWQEGATP